MLTCVCQFLRWLFVIVDLGLCFVGRPFKGTLTFSIHHSKYSKWVNFFILFPFLLKHLCQNWKLMCRYQMTSWGLVRHEQLRFGMATTQSTQHKETHSRKQLVEDDTMEVSERWDFIKKNSYKMLEITCLRSNSIAHKYRGTWRAKVVYIKHLSFF